MRVKPVDPGIPADKLCKQLSYNDGLCKARQAAPATCSAPTTLTTSTITCPAEFPEILTLNPDPKLGKLYQSAVCDRATGKWTLSRTSPSPKTDILDENVEQIGCSNFKI
ncbi:hypothetical protein PRIPAC_82948 [Pristionchus pacificus]|uniref:Uncharacterized protein n=1 Tax=Pristionchus pacificus TaxID=54126 RepID=A0A2A6C3J5_PRIPA|nr:hypothetical protein PRIPAC_82948 [Pristionchus pacificus]|eukprot:PDM72696.1 hypothetical protein PRIPAC_39130 [Pristionchus pacificus]